MPWLAIARWKFSANALSCAYKSCRRCSRIGLTCLGSGGDQVEASPGPRMIKGMTVVIDSACVPAIAPAQRLSQPVLAPPGRALPFSRQSWASKCERCWYGGAIATTGSS